MQLIVCLLQMSHLKFVKVPSSFITCFFQHTKSETFDHVYRKKIKISYIFNFNLYLIISILLNLVIL